MDPESSTRRTRKRSAAAPEDPQPAESSTRRTNKKRKADTTVIAPVQKRARTATKGRLAGLLDISLDVVFEVGTLSNYLDTAHVLR
jgi:hypothetical protein